MSSERRGNALRYICRFGRNIDPQMPDPTLRSTEDEAEMTQREVSDNQVDRSNADTTTPEESSEVTGNTAPSSAITPTQDRPVVTPAETASTSTGETLPKGSTVDCAVCFDVMTPDTQPHHPPTRNCTHGLNVCRACLARHISTEVSDRIHDENQVDCLICRTPMTYQDIQASADPETLARYDRQCL